MAPSSSLIAKLKVQLKLSISRLRMTQQKDTAVAKQQRRAMAQLLEQGKDASALIRTENIIRTDITTELHELLELYCELLLARLGLLEATPCDPGLAEAVKSIIYAAPRTDIKELQASRALLVEKFGKEFGTEAMDGQGVSEKVLHKLKVEAPSDELVRGYLSEIARTYGVQWPRPEPAKPKPSPDGDGDEDDDPPGGEKVKLLEPALETDELSRATPPRSLDSKSPVRIAPPSPSSENPAPKIKFPGPPDLKPGAKAVGNKASSAPVGGKIPDVDELAKRFAALKR